MLNGSYGGGIFGLSMEGGVLDSDSGSESDQSKEAVVLVKREVGLEEEVEKGRRERNGFRERMRVEEETNDPIRDAMAGIEFGDEETKVVRIVIVVKTVKPKSRESGWNVVN